MDSANERKIESPKYRLILIRPLLCSSGRQSPIQGVGTKNVQLQGITKSGMLGMEITWNLSNRRIPNVSALLFGVAPPPAKCERQTPADGIAKYSPGIEVFVSKPLFEGVLTNGYIT